MITSNSSSTTSNDYLPYSDEWYVPSDTDLREWAATMDARDAEERGIQTSYPSFLDHQAPDELPFVPFEPEEENWGDYDNE